MPLPRLSGLRARFAREDWNIGFVAQSAEDIVRRGLTAPVRWLDQPNPWRILAAPLCHEQPDGTRVILAEQINQWVGRGEIWKAVIPPGQDPVRAVFHPWMRSNIHLSYALTVRDNGLLYLMVQSWRAGALHLWCERDGALAHAGPLIDRPVLDATPWRDERGWWLFCALQDAGPHEQLHLFHAPAITGPWTPHPANPVKVDPGSARPAGPLFMAGGKLIRPAQDCSRTYGDALVLHEITRLDQHGFAERCIRRLEPQGAYPDGLHTLCPAGDMTIVDGRRWLFQPLDVPRKFVAALRSRVRPYRRAALPDRLTLPHETPGAAAPPTSPADQSA